MVTDTFHSIAPSLAFSAGSIVLAIAALVAILVLYLVVRQLNLTEKNLQETVHKIEEGVWKKWVILAMYIVPTLAVLVGQFYGDSGYRGLWHPRAFEQAEIAREIARGHGFTTQVLRPAAIQQLEENTGRIPLERMPDIYHAPLWPVVLAPFVWLGRDTWTFSQKEYAYVCDKIVAGVACGFFLLSVVVTYFLARRLFDNRMALMVVGLMLLCDRLWEFALSGLPQMLMLFLFSCAMYTLLRAIQVHCARNPIEEDDLALAEESDEMISEEVETGTEAAGTEPAAQPEGWIHTPEPWLLATGLIFGLLALTHAITLWIFLAALIFCLIYFRPPLRVALILIGAVVLLYTPWLVRNYRADGGFKGIAGIAWYSVLSSIQGSEDSIMRSMDPLASGFGVSAFPRKAVAQIHAQIGSIHAYLGYVVLAPIFFISLLHRFKRREIGVFRWLVLLLWLSALGGMSLFGLDQQVLQANDLHILFIPIMSMYGMAFVLMLWMRLEISRIRLVNYGFFGLLFVISGVSFLSTCLELIGLTGQKGKVQWPPYVPPSIAALGTWTSEKEIMMSDMPWAVAWYADRRCLWLPSSVSAFRDLYDYRLKAPIVGMYLTPVSGDRPFLTDIEKGEYREWAPFITRMPIPKGFPLHAATSLAVEGMCVVYFDRDRWTNKED